VNAKLVDISRNRFFSEEVYPNLTLPYEGLLKHSRLKFKLLKCLMLKIPTFSAQFRSFKNH